MKRLSIFIVTLVAAAVSTSVAVASSPHFIGTPTCSFSSSAVLTCSGKIAGLGSDVVSADLSTTGGTATWNCVNHGGNVAPGQPVAVAPQTGGSQPVTAHNGSITFSPSIAISQPNVTDYCPSGKWHLQLVSASLDNVTIEFRDASNGLVYSHNFGTVSYP